MFRLQPNENFIFNWSYCFCPIFFLFQTLYTQLLQILILIDVQYLQNAGFSFEKTKISISMKMIC